MMAARKIDDRRAERGSLPTKLLSCGFQSANKSLINRRDYRCPDLDS
jgi:hypothetical protein